MPLAKEPPKILTNKHAENHRVFIFLRTRSKHCTVAHLGSDPRTPSTFISYCLVLTCTYMHIHTHAQLGHAHTVSHTSCPCDAITLNARHFLECVCVSHTQTLCFAWWVLPTPFHQTHSYLSFCSQLIDQFLWEAFLNHPRKVLVPSQCSLQHHILYNITPNCDYNFLCCFF